MLFLSQGGPWPDLCLAGMWTGASEGAALHVSRLRVVTGGPRSCRLVALCVP